MRPKPPPYQRIVRRGHRFDRRTWAAILLAEAHFGRAFAITQGSYSDSVGASAGTHDGGGAVDLSVRGMDADQPGYAVRCLRRAGWAAWLRPELDGVWSEHIHAVLLDHDTAAPLAKTQWADYRNGLDGLAGHAPDPTWRPDPLVVFDYPAWWAKRRLADRIKDLTARLRLIRRRHHHTRPVKED